MSDKDKDRSVDFLESSRDVQIIRDGHDAQEDQLQKLKTEHDRMVQKLAKKFSSKRARDYRWRTTRTEAAADLDEYGMSRPVKSKLDLDSLLKLSENYDSRRSLRNFSKKKVLPKPLEKPAAERLARKVNFKELSDDIAKYDPVVKAIRRADQLVFPAQNKDDKLEFGVNRTDPECNTGQRKTIALTKVEKEINEEIAKSQGNIESDEKFLTDNEIRILKSMSLEEARKLHHEIQRRRILMSYQESKFRRIRKIKSKKYHRLLKKDKLKKTVEEFDQMVAENDDRALEKLDELDRLRALERASLKHMNTGKWAQHHKIRAKYNDQSREELNEQLRINQTMMKKRSLAILDSDDDDDLEDDENESRKQPLKVVKSVPNSIEIEIPENYNPWMSVQPKNKKTMTKRIKLEQQPEDDTEKFFQKRIEARIMKNRAAELDERIRFDAHDERILDENGVGTGEASDEATVANQNDDDDDESQIEEKRPTADLNPASLITNLNDVRKPGRLQELADSDEAAEEDPGEEEPTEDDIDFKRLETGKFLREAFADDDVIEQFEREKKQREQPEKTQKQGDGYLPGWGHWSGAGIKVTRRRQNTRVKKTAGKERKLTEKICNAIVLDGYQEPAGRYKVARKPREVNNSSDLERKLLKPIGSVWNPETISRTLKQPKIIIRSGFCLQ